MLSVKQDGIKYHFLSFWYDSTRNWTPVSRTIGEASYLYIYIYIYIYIYYILLLLLLFYFLRVFHTSENLMVFNWSLSDSKSPQVSKTLLSNLAVFNNTVVWMVSTLPLLSRSSSPCCNPLVTVPSVPVTIWHHRHFHVLLFLSSLARSRYYYYYYYHYYYSLIRAFHISISRWVFTGVWVAASLLKSPGLFLVFWPFSVMLSFGWSPLVRQLPSPLVPLVIL